MGCAASARTQFEEWDKKLAPLRDIADYDKDGTRGPDLMSVHGYKLRTRYMYPENKSDMKALIVFVHGAGSHVHRNTITRAAKQFNSKGYGFFGVDLQGMGLSEGPRFLVEDYNDLIADAEAFVNTVTAAHPGLPWFVMGQSMGGALALLLARRIQSYSEEPDETERKTKRRKNSLLDGNSTSDDYGSVAGSFTILAGKFIGCIVTCPAIHNQVEPPGCVVCCMKGCCLPLCPHSLLPAAGGMAPEQVWRDPEQLRIEHEDPLNGLVDGQFEPFRIATGNQLLELTHKVESILPTITFPFIVLHGAADQVIPMSGSLALFEQSLTPPAHKAYHPIPESYHDMMGDPRHQDVLRIIQHWMDQAMEDLVLSKRFRDGIDKETHKLKDK